MVYFLALQMVFSVEMSLYNMVHQTIVLLGTGISYVCEGKETQDELPSLSLQNKCKGMTYIGVRLITDSKSYI